MKSPSRNKRRGVLLLVVLSILVLFALIGLTFVVVAGQYHQAARINILVDQTHEQGPEIVEQAFVDLLRGTTNTNSALFGVDTNGDGTFNSAVCNSLLEDVYGTGSFRAPLQAFNTAPQADGTRLLIALPGTQPYSTSFDYFVGRTLTFTDSGGALNSTRIRETQPLGPRHIFYVEPIVNSIGIEPTSAALANIVISARPFSGSDADGQNESYDAPDWANPFLAYIPVGTTNQLEIIPSFVDRAIIDTNVPADGVPNVRFDASNPAHVALLPIQQQMAVDNDCDGIPDSVWIDIGMEIKTAPDGRRYKPLVAYLCIDLDGRINVNAHGSPNQPDSSANLLGMGPGPADIQLSELSWVTTLSDWRNLITARVGADGQPGLAAVDPETAKSLYQGPQPYSNTAVPPTAGAHRYGSPLDLDGDGQVAVDADGVPTFTNAMADTVVNSPYELNLVYPNGRDNPFAAADMERIFRWWDVDSSMLSARLMNTFNLNPATANAQDIRRLQRTITTQSWHIPVPNLPGDGYLAFVKRYDTAANAVILTDAQIADMFPRSLIVGGKMDLNRAWQEATATDAQLARQLFAKHLFCVMMFSMDRAYDGTASQWRINYRIPVDAAEALTADEHYELTVQRIAQWAVNVVDFRDRDAIMTPFEYDSNPFDGWDPLAEGTVTDPDEIAVASLLELDGTTPLATVRTYNSVGDRRLVWGCEFPDLILTEVLGLHDRRVKDTMWDDRTDAVNEEPPATGDSAARGYKRVYTKHDGTMEDTAKNGDKDLDQFRIPLGSLFVELACRRNARSGANYNPIYPPELYTSGQLDLNKTDPGGLPVWRLAISAPHHGKADGTARTHNAAVAGDTRTALAPANRRTNAPNTVAFQPEHMSLLPIYDGTSADAQLKFLDIERYVWLASAAGASLPAPAAGEQTAPSTRNTFVAAAAAVIDPGGHLVVAPRASTPIGSETNAALDPVNPAANPLDVSGVAHVLAQGQTSAAVTVGLNITEPLLDNHYPQPTKTNERYDDGNTIVNGTEVGLCPDQPLDSQAGAPLKESGLLETDTEQGNTQQGYKTVFLQRLADPTRNYDQVTNPYVTVDWIPVDLTTYNGEDQIPGNWAANYQATAGDYDPDDPNLKNFAVADVEGARERGAAAGTNHWAQIWTARNWVDNANANFPYRPENSLGTLNANLAGEFPWLVWLNRPFVSHYDLLLVPHTRTDGLLHRFDFSGAAPHPYGHVLDFTLDSATAADAPTFYRLLEFVGVPSRFAGVQKWTEPLTPVSTTVLADRFPGFREPGLVNPNTIAGPDVYDAVFQGQYATWDQFRNRRMGHDYRTAGEPYGDPSITTPNDGIADGDAFGRFMNPVKGPWTQAGASAAGRTLLAGGPVDSTAAPYEAPSPQPLLGAVLDDANKKHPWLYYQKLLRLGNTTTSHSNVFAIWITVGYFELDGSGNIVRELGADTGEVRRHRGFYIVDRSIPVAYERGRNHNVEKTVLLRRYIE